jgi:hypothetical protein
MVITNELQNATSLVENDVTRVKRPCIVTGVNNGNFGFRRSVVPAKIRGRVGNETNLKDSGRRCVQNFEAMLVNSFIAIVKHKNVL